MKKALTAFLVALGLTIGFSALRLIGGVSALALFLLAYTNALSVVITLVGIGVFFAAFYLLANTNNVIAKRSTIIALLSGILLGSAVSVFLTWTMASQWACPVMASLIKKYMILLISGLAKMGFVLIVRLKDTFLLIIGCIN